MMEPTIHRDNETITKSTASVLVVEDNDTLRNLYCKAMHRAGYRVEQAVSVQQAQQLLATVAFDVVILDLGLPDANGIDVIRQYGRSQTFIKPQFVIVSGNDRAEYQTQNDTDYFLFKPVSIPMLLDLIERIVTMRKLSQP
jgi:DNA-binding response OmpR family regulator